MKKRWLVAAALWPALTGVAWAQDVKDCPYFPGMPAYDIGKSDDKEFDEAMFFDGKALQTIEGRKWFREYSLREGATTASELQITRNYANALKAAGGTVLFEGVCQGEKCADFEGVRFVTGRMKKGDKEVWLLVQPQAGGSWYELTALEKQAMKQDVTASGLWEELSAKGHVALYVNFDTNRAEIRQDSLPMIEQVTALLREQPGLALVVEGHTDNTGIAARNKALSEARAKSVVAALVERGIDAKRLAAAGFGAERPIASNATEDGRAQNRRVELVKR
jgi:outer membrane protein OmpA-like peptidoglycan-associated protein